VPLVALANDLLKTDADGAAKQPFKDVAFAADAVVIMQPLCDAVCVFAFDERARHNPIAWVERRDVRISGNAFLIPGPVDQYHDPFHLVIPSERPSFTA
jgi:hypothetical protein